MKRPESEAFTRGICIEDSLSILEPMKDGEPGISGPAYQVDQRTVVDTRQFGVDERLVVVGGDVQGLALLTEAVK